MDNGNDMIEDNHFEAKQFFMVPPKMALLRPLKTEKNMVVRTGRNQVMFPIIEQSLTGSWQVINF